MASYYTTNFGFCQWEPGDNFIREEFNQDNAKVEQALSGLDGRAAELERTLPLVSYNVYNLMLQSYYDGKQTGYKKALIFDGFMDGSMIASKSECIVRTNNRLSLMEQGQGDISFGPYYANVMPPVDYEQSTPVCTATGYGTLTGAAVKTLNLVSGPQVMAHWELKAYLNGALFRNVSVPLYCQANSVSAEEDIYLDPQTIKPGDTFYMTMKAVDKNHQVMWNSNGKIGGRFKVTPHGGTSGTVTTPALALPDRKRLRGWLKHRGGAVTLSVRDSGGTDHPMTVADTRQTVSLQGVACTEKEFILDPAPESDTLTFSLGMSLGASNDMDVFDCGIMLF